MKEQPILRDERYYAVENASYKIGYLILFFGTLLLISVRGLLFKEDHWDFFALAWISSVAATVYQYRHKIIAFSWKLVYFMIAIMLLAAAVAYIVGRMVK